MLAQAEVFSGPLPPPDVLTGYNSAFPECAERIVQMAEAQSAHRQGLESKKLEADIGNERLGMIFALVISVVGIVAGGALVAYGKDIAGYGALLAGFAAPIARLFAEWRQRRELKERADLARLKPQAPTEISADDSESN